MPGGVASVFGEAEDFETAYVLENASDSICTACGCSGYPRNLLLSTAARSIKAGPIVHWGGVELQPSTIVQHNEGRSEQRSRCSYGFEQKNNSGANCADCDRLLIHKAGLTVKFQSSWMDRHDRRTGHNVLDLQDRQRGVQLSEGREVVEDRFNRGIDQLIGLIAG